MKHRLLPLPALCGVLSAVLAPAPAVRAQASTNITWAQSYGVGSYDYTGTANPNQNTSGTDTPTAVAAMPDGGFVVAGDLALPELWQPSAYDHEACAALVRYAADGRILWQQVLRQDNDHNPGSADYSCSHISQMLADAQGNLYLNMTRANASADNSKSGVGNYIVLSATIAKFDANGTLVWQTAFGGDAFGYPDNPSAPAQYRHIAAYNAMSLTADGGVVACGSEGSDDGFGYPFFFKINADGSLGFHRAFAAIGQYLSAIAVAQSVDGARFILAMDTNSNVLVMDASGKIVAQRDLADDAGQTERVTRILANADGTFTLLSNGGYYGGPYPQVSNNYVRKINPDLTSVWETVIHDSLPGLNLAPTSDGGYLVTTADAGNTVLGGDHGSPKNDAVVIRLDANGKLAASFLLGGPDEETIPFVAQTTDGGYALATTSYSYHLSDPLNHPDWWLVKADRTGRVQNFEGIMAPVNGFYAVSANLAASTPSNHYSGASPSGNRDGAAYAFNAEPFFVLQDLGAKTGVNKPTSIFQATPAISDNHPAFLAGEVALSNGVYYLSFPDNGDLFGYYSYLSDPHYIYHFDLGYEYVFDAADGKSGVYLYDFKSGGFFYTSPVFPFPYLYDFSLNSVVYYYPDPSNAGHYNTNGVRYFYEFANGQIISK